MHCLALHGGGAALRVRCLGYDALVAELGGFGLEGSLGGAVVAVVEFAADDVGGVMDVLLGKDFTVLDGLDDAVMVILMDFFVDSRIDLFVACGLDGFLCHGGGGLLLDCCVVAPGTRHEVVEFGFGAVHGVWVFFCGCCECVGECKFW